MSDELESARICAIETELAAVHEAYDRVAAERDSLRAKLAEAVETWARNADSYLSLEAEVKTLNRMLDAEKEARKRAEAERDELGWSGKRIDGAEFVDTPNLDRLLAIEREARALLLALDVEPRSYGVTAALRAALGAK